MGFADSLKYDEKGLIPVIAQDYKNNQVLMLAYANKEAVERTVKEGTCYYYSRSRQELWHKGDTSGHFQIVKEIYFDCDSDALLIKVDLIGAACHTGKRSCFYRDVNGKEVL